MSLAKVGKGTGDGVFVGVGSIVEVTVGGVVAVCVGKEDIAGATDSAGGCSGTVGVEITITLSSWERRETGVGVTVSLSSLKLAAGISSSD